MLNLRAGKLKCRVVSGVCVLPIVALLAGCSAGREAADQLQKRIDEQSQLRKQGELPKPVPAPDIYQDFRT